MRQAAPNATDTQRLHVTDGFDSLVPAAVTLSHDPATVDGLVKHGALRTSTQRVWLTSGPAVANGL